MYMNCTPIAVSGNGNDTIFLMKLPNLFIANLPRRACSTVEGFGYTFPDPRDSVQISIQAKIGEMLNHNASSLWAFV